MSQVKTIPFVRWKNEIGHIRAQKRVLHGTVRATGDSDYGRSEEPVLRLLGIILL